MTSDEPETDGVTTRHAIERFLPVLDRMSEALIVATMDGDVVFWNRAGLEMHGYGGHGATQISLEEFSCVFELSTPDGTVLPLDEWPMSRIIRGDDVAEMELIARRRDQEWERTLVYTGGTFRSVDDRQLAFVTVTDISPSRRAERERDERDRRLRIAVEAAGLAIYESDAVARTMTFSAEAAELLGFPAGVPVPGDDYLDRLHPADRAGAVRAFADLNARPVGSIGRGEYRWVGSGGELQVLSWAARTMPGAEPGLPRRIGAFLDVTAARRTERRLATQLAVSEQLAAPGPIDDMLRGVLEALCEAEGFDVGTWWEVDEREQVARCAEVWRRSEQFDQLVAFTSGLAYRRGEGMAGLVWARGEPLAFDEVPDDPSHRRTPLARWLGLCSFVAFPVTSNGRVVGVIDFLGTTPLVVDQPMLDGFVAIGRQIGLVLERRRLERELLQAQRLEALGVLSRGIAHDFNNILTAITGNVELALRDRELSDGSRGRLASVMAASVHARDLVDQILTFAQQQPGKRAPISLLGVAAESVRLLRSMVPAHVDIRLVTDRTPTVLADATQLQQVVVNLGVNAWQALEGAGTIEVRVGSLDVAAGPAEVRPWPPGSYAVVSVSDDGAGMDELTLQRIFDPFFTTKSPREGTGLGLSVVHGIVRAHDGHVQVVSTPGAGTRVDVLLPAVAEAPAVVAEVPVAWAFDDERNGPAVTGAGLDGAHVLFVDDEPLLADLAQQMFPVLGYRVTVHADAADAIAYLREHASEIDLVVTDMSMPKHTGLEVAAAAAVARPGLPVVLMSGYVSGDMAAEADRLGVREVIGKPVSIQSLADSLRRALS